MWGQEIIYRIAINNARIIPTRVGTRMRKVIEHLGSEDHPHACGDKSVVDHNIRTYRGSSPRVWGQAMTVADIVP